jgi:hypothetical protein
VNSHASVGVRCGETIVVRRSRRRRNEKGLQGTLGAESARGRSLEIVFPGGSKTSALGSAKLIRRDLPCFGFARACSTRAANGKPLRK